MMSILSIFWSSKISRNLVISDDCTLVQILVKPEAFFPSVYSSRLGFPTGRDSATFPDKGTEIPSLSQDKGTMGQAQNFAAGWDSQSKPGMGHGMGHGFDTLPRAGPGFWHPVPSRPGKNRDNHGTKGKKLKEIIILRLSSSDKGKSMKMKR